MRKLVLVCVMFLAGGCAGLRFEPSEIQKQNAWLHEKTTQAAAEIAVNENSSEQLRKLTHLSAAQSGDFVRYYGEPKQVPNVENVSDLIKEENFEIAAKAAEDGGKRPDVWVAANNFIELGIGIAGLFGGVLGARAVRFLREARTKSQALREIIAGNELFKTQNSQAADAFKSAQGGQSATTRQVVAGLK
ncbi:MAG: hypothetical protein A2Y07_07475 [Planctomycetes bacterium GWF2_50_10]|nr:MAG: hypothetical protein A2Y07_07475 [Planctomycetes bacterium GWF2_50_10]